MATQTPLLTGNGGIKAREGVVDGWMMVGSGMGMATMNVGLL
jgi:hypothetical protein